MGFQDKGNLFSEKKLYLAHMDFDDQIASENGMSKSSTAQHIAMDMQWRITVVWSDSIIA